MSRRPNILFIIADDHRHDALGCAGPGAPHTPALDALAASGVRFTQAHIMGGMHAAVCVPSRAAALSGASIFRCLDGAALAPGMTLLPEAFRQAGYDTYAVGKWHHDQASFHRCFAGGGRIFFGGMSDPYDIELQDCDPAGCYDSQSRRVPGTHATDIFTDAAVDYLERRPRDRPFLLYVAYTAPHDPRVAPAEFRGMYRDDEIGLPPNAWPEHPFDNGEMNVRDERLESFPRTPDAIRRHIADYFAMISHLDSGVGRIVETLRRLGLDRDTIVVYTADHGLAVGQHGLMGKQNMYEHSIRIPLIMSGPGIPAGRAVRGLVWQIDIFPTVCEMAGIPTPASAEGQSLAPMIESGADGRKSLFVAYRDIQRTVKDERWKLIEYRRSAMEPGSGSDRTQLFDLQRDPWERFDQSDDPAQAIRIAELRGLLRDWQRRVGDPFPYRSG